jgi:hypothetical protein
LEQWGRDVRGDPHWTGPGRGPPSPRKRGRGSYSAEIADFKAEVINTGDLDEFTLSIEVSQGIDWTPVVESLGERTKLKFGLTPKINVLERGTLANEFESAVKAPRFVDRRQC